MIKPAVFQPLNGVSYIITITNAQRWMMWACCVLLSSCLVTFMLVAVKEHKEIDKYKWHIAATSANNARLFNRLRDLETEIQVHEQNEIAWEHKDFNCEFPEVKPK